MMIEDWFKNKGTYQEGIVLLKCVIGNTHLYKRLANAQENARNRAALKYELNKYRNKKISFPSEKPKQPKITQPKTIEEVSLEKTNEEYSTIRLSEINEPEVQARYVEGKNAFYQMALLKRQYNRLAPEEEKKALKYLIEMMRLYRLNKAIWEEIDYYFEHKKPMPKGEDYSQYTPLELHKKRQLLHQSLSKRKVTIRKMESKKIPEGKQLKHLSKLNAKKAQYKEVELNIQRITEILDKL